MDTELDPKIYDPQFIQTCKKIWSFIQKEAFDPEFKPYVFCLTTKNDHLSQWRGYADFGRGFSLELQTKKLFSQLDQDGILWGKVQYESNMIETLMADLVQSWLRLCHLTATNNNNILTKQMGTDLAILFLQAAFAVLIKSKHYGFAEEEEWRLFTFQRRGSPVLKFRPHRFGIADYYEYNADPYLFINGIMSGPCGPDIIYMRSSMESLTKINNNVTLAYRKSSTPFV